MEKNRLFEPPLFELDGVAQLTGLKKGNRYGRFAILAVNDPLGFSEDAADVIARSLKDVTEIARNPMFTLLSGNYKGVDLIICSTGSGGADTEIAIMDLLNYTDVDTFIRLGTSGTQQKEIGVGDIVISSGVVRDEGLTKEYIASQYPAVASYEVVLSMVEACQRMNIIHHVGITRANDSIYSGQGRAIMGYLPMPQDRIVEYWANARVLNVERESAVILTLSQIFGVRGGAVNVVCNSSVTQKLGVSEGIDNAILVTLEGIFLLAKHDEEKKVAKQPYWSPLLNDTDISPC